MLNLKSVILPLKIIKLRKKLYLISQASLPNLTTKSSYLQFPVYTPVNPHQQ